MPASERDRGPKKVKYGHEDLDHDLEEGIMPAAILSEDLFRAMLGTQRLLLKRYRKVLEDQPKDDALLDTHKAAVGALLGCWVDTADALHKHLDGLLNAQFQFIAQYLQILEGLTKSPDGPKSADKPQKPSSGAKS